MACSAVVFESRSDHRRAERLWPRLPALSARRPIVVKAVKGLSDRHGPVHAGTFVRERIIALSCTPAEFPRILVHELFHFVWPHAGNPRRRDFEALLRSEWRAGARGELGWSAEWRKEKLAGADVRNRTRRWREYCCESFCDSAAWLYSGVTRHEEYTLLRKFRAARREWFRGVLGRGPLAV